MKNVLITGSTGMVGKGILLACLDSPAIASVTLVNRSPVGMAHPKIKEILLADFTALDSIKDQLGPLDGCFHCMGVSAMGLSEEQYARLTFVVTQKLADLCFAINPAMTFNYVSGAGTDSSEKGRLMWARVKGKAENYVLAKGFGRAYMFRPGAIIPENGIRSSTPLYNRIYTVMRPLFPLLKKLDSVTTTSRIGRVMIRSLEGLPFPGQHLGNSDINALAGG